MESKMRCYTSLTLMSVKIVGLVQYRPRLRISGKMHKSNGSDIARSRPVREVCGGRGYSIMVDDGYFLSLKLLAQIWDSLEDTRNQLHDATD
ncbi:hypothetical protein Tco_0722138 [Tanacetum coccineum]